MNPSAAFFVLKIVSWLVVAYFIVLNTVYLLTSFLAYGALRRYSQRLSALDLMELLTDSGVPPVTLIVPAFNEEAVCIEALKSFLSLNYPSYEVIFVNDGSEDRTLEKVIQAFEMKPAARFPTASLKTREIKGIYRSSTHPKLWLIDKENGGKADALNAAINYSRTPLFCATDADSLLERDALIRVVRPFLEDRRTIAAGGIIRIINGCRVKDGVLLEVARPSSLIATFQVLEYLRAFLSGRMGWDVIGAVLIISGAFSLFRRQIVVEVGGYAPDTVGEDMEIVVRLHRYCSEKNIPYRITFIPDPVSWTECPEDLKTLARQRIRWQRGLIESLARHRKMLLNPRYGTAGVLAFPYFYFLEMLGPVVEITGYIAFLVLLLKGWVSSVFSVVFLMVAILLGTAISIAAVSLEELTFRRYPRISDLLVFFSAAIIEGLGYRQLITYFRFRGLMSSLAGSGSWGRMKRKGFGN